MTFIETPSCHAYYSNFWLRGYTSRLLGEPFGNSRVYQGQAKMDWEAGHNQASKDSYKEN